MLRATPRLPDEDSTRIDPGRSPPSRSAASTISVAAFSLIDPAKLKPSHLRKSDCPKIGSRSTYSSSSLKSWGTETIGIAASPVPAELVEEVVDDVEAAVARHPVVDVLADRQVEHAETERREHRGPVRGDRHAPGDHVVEGAVHEVAVAGELLGEVRRGVGLEAVLDVVDDVRRGQHDLGREIAQRHMQ